MLSIPVTLSGVEGALLLGDSAPSTPLRVTVDVTSTARRPGPLRVTGLVTYQLVYMRD